MKTEKIKLYENREDVTLTSYILDDSLRLWDIILLSCAIQSTLKGRAVCRTCFSNI